VPDAAVAVILQALPWAADAVNRPEVVMAPQEADHLTAEFAVNCWVRPWPVVALEGVMTMGDLIVAVVATVRPVPSLAFAVTVQDDWVRGALKRPAAVMAPHDAVKVEATLAVNC